MTKSFVVRISEASRALSVFAAVCVVPPALAESAPAQIYAPNAVTCVAGCRDKAPQLSDTASLLPTDPLPKPHHYDNNMVLRDVWCGEQGSCIALNHIAPPRLRDRSDDFYYTRNYIAVFQVHTW